MHKIKNAIDHTIKKMGLRTRILEYKVLEIWDDVVGDTINKHASVHKLHHGVLFVNVDHPIWIQHLNFAAMDIKNRLNKAVGAKVVKEIRFKAGNRSNKQNTYQDVDTKKPLQVDLSREEMENIKLMVQEIRDPEIRDTAASFIKQGKKLNLYKIKIGWKACSQCGVLIEPKEQKCFHCNLQEMQATRSKIRALLWEIPWLSYDQTSSCVTGLDRETYSNVRREMIQELWENFCKAAKNIKTVTVPKTHIHTYVMLRTGLSPEKVTKEIIWQTLGDNMAKKLLGGY